MRLSIPHFPQEQATSCLPAAVRMVLASLNIELTELAIAKIVQAEARGTPLFNIELLEEANLGVEVWSGEMVAEAVKQSIDDGVPAIAAVWTGPLPYWTDNRAHVVVVVGYDEQTVALNDPKFAEAPQTVPWAEFLAAWEEFGRFGAVVRKAE